MTARSVKKGTVEIRNLWVRRWAADRVREELGIPGCRSQLRLDNSNCKQKDFLPRKTRKLTEKSRMGN